MLAITPKHKIFIAVQHIDFRRGLDGIAALCRQQWQLDPLSGHFFIFRNRKANSIKILAYDSHSSGGGFTEFFFLWTYRTMI